MVDQRSIHDECNAMYSCENRIRFLLWISPKAEARNLLTKQ